MTRRHFTLVLAALVLSSLTIQAGSTPQRARLGMVITQSDIASQIGFQVIKNGGNAIDAAVATRLRPRGDAPDRRQHRRRRLHRLSPRHRRADGVRLPRSRAVALVTGDVVERRQVRRRAAPQQSYGRRRPRHGRGPAPGVERSGIETVEGTGPAGHCPRPRRLRDFARPRPIAGGRARQLPEVSGLAGAVLQERQAVRSRRDTQAARPGAHADAHRGSRPGRIL